MDLGNNFYYDIVAKLLLEYIESTRMKFFQMVEIPSYTKTELLRICKKDNRTDCFHFIDMLVKEGALELDEATAESRFQTYYINDKKMAVILRRSQLYKDFKIVCSKY